MKQLILLALVLCSVNIFAVNLYWVNGTGSYNDPNHWSTTSGGNSCGCVPSDADNVFFNLASFSGNGDTVYIDVNSYCNNMDWSGVNFSPTIVGYGELHINGNLKLSTQINFQLEGTTFFESNNLATTVQTNNKIFKGHVNFNNQNGEWILMDGLTTEKQITLTGGILNTNGKAVVCRNFSSDNTNLRGLVLGNTTFTLTGSDCYYYDCDLYGPVWNLNHINFNLNSGTSTIVFASDGYITLRFGDNLTYYNVNINAIGSQIILVGNNIFNQFISYKETEINNNNTFKLLKLYTKGVLQNGNIISRAVFGESPYTGDYTLKGNNIIDTLQLKAGRRYFLDNTNTLIVNKLLQSNGNCSEPIFINTVENNNEGQSNIQMPVGAIAQINYTAFKNINASGGANFTANNSSDIYLNTGINFNTPITKSLYWVGNSGNWYDSNHWSLTSGGTGGACVPGRYDDVIFDANSFTDSSNITIEQNRVAFCRNFNSSQSHTNSIINVLGELDVFGSISLNNQLNFQGTKISFESEAGTQTITSNGCNLGILMQFNRLEGNWVFTDEFKTKEPIYLFKGTLDMSGKDIYCNKFISVDNYYPPVNYKRTLNMISTNLYLTHNACDWYCDNRVWDVTATDSLSIEFNVGSKIYVTGKSYEQYPRNYFSTGNKVYNIVSVTDTLSYVEFNGSGIFNELNSAGGISTSGSFNFNKLIVNKNLFLGGGVDTIHYLSVGEYARINGLNTINYGLFKGSTYFLDNNQFDTLIFSEGKVNKLGDHYNYNPLLTVNSYFKSTGTCTNPVIIEGINNSSAALLEMPPGAVFEMNYTTCKNLDASGGAVFNAYNSSDVSNNFGINFITPASKTVYWVGGNGDWNNPVNWSASSGGLGGYCIPTQYDDVVFDQNSFSDSNQVVTIPNLFAAYCRNLTTTGILFNPAIQLNDFLNVYGSVYLSQNLNINTSCCDNSYTPYDLIFRSTDTNTTITSNGCTFNAPIIFDGIGGKWTTIDDFTNNSNVSLINGFIDFNQKEINVEAFYSNGNYVRGFNITNCEVYLTHNGCYYCDNRVWDLNEDSLSFIGGETSQIYITGTSGPIYYVHNSFSGGNQNYNNLFITDTNSVVVVNNNGRFNKIIFNENAFLNGYNIIDTLMVKKYFEAVNADTINYLLCEGRTELNGPHVIKKAIIKGSANIRNYCSFDSLTITRGENYYFQAKDTITINKNITAIGTCTDPVNIKSSDLSVGNGIIKMPSDATTNIDYAFINHMTVLGGINFSVTNSSDILNNEGINFINPMSQNLYWVGGSGQWHDSTHWSSTSGGTGGYCIPSIHDHVFFDENSFNDSMQVVDITNLYPAYCNNFTTSNSVLKPRIVNHSSLNIYGSISLSPLFEFYENPITFQSNNNGNAVTGNGCLIGVAMVFNGAGEWTVTDSLKTLNSINHNSGVLNFSNQVISCDALYSNTYNQRTLNIDGSTFYLNHNGCWYCDNSVWNVNNTNINFIGGNNSTLYCTGTTNGSWGPNGFVGGDQTYSKVINTNTTGSLNISSNGHFNYVKTEGITAIYGNNTFGTFMFNNDGAIYNRNTFDTLYFAPSKSYMFQSNDTTFINQAWINPGNCSHFTNITSNDNAYALLAVNGTQTITNNNVSKIKLVSGTVNAINCNVFTLNTGFNFTSPGARNLFWVGGTGNWSDEQHWSANSGGAGGECIPSSNDNVYFDANSFPISGATVSINEKAYCRNMDWTGSLRNPLLSGTDELYLFGSIKLIPQMQFNFGNMLHFMSKDDSTLISFANINLANNITFDGISNNSGWLLEDRLKTTGNINLYNGKFNTNNQNVYCGNFYPDNSYTNKALILGNSTFTITADNASWNLDVNGMSLYPGNSSIQFNGLGTIYFNSDSLNYNRVVFKNTSASGYISGYNTFNEISFYGHGYLNNKGSAQRVNFYSNGTLIGNNSMDTLYFAEERTYNLTLNDTTFVNEFMVRGRNGLPITIRSNNNGDSSYIYVSSGTVCSNYLVLEGIHAIGGADFYAGESSIDNGLNSGWSFTSCYLDIPVVSDISCNNYNNGSIKVEVEGGQQPYGIQWTDGSTDFIRENLSEGTYSYTVTDNIGSILTNQVVITNPPVFVANISILGDTVFCDNGNVLLSSSEASDYNWSNGSNTQEIVVNSTGIYSVQLTNANGCIATSRSIEVVVNPLPDNNISISGSTTFCMGDSVILSATDGYSYNWSNGETNASIVVKNSDSMNVVITDANNCSNLSSTIVILVNPLPEALIVINGNDTICQGSNVSVSANAGYNYYWNDGSANQDLYVTTSGEYAVEITDGNGCKDFSDTVYITVLNPQATINALGNTTFCEGDSVILEASGGTSFNWSNGSSNNQVVIYNSDNLWVTVYDDFGCSATSLTINTQMNYKPNVYFNSIADICDTADSFLLTEGSPWGGFYNGPGVANDMFNPSTGAGNYTITYTYIDGNGCSNSAQGSIVVLDCSGTVYVNSIAGEGYNIYPNPVKDLMRISVTNELLHHVKITNSVGQVLIETSFNKSTVLDLSDLPEGFYFITSDEFCERFVKE